MENVYKKGLICEARGRLECLFISIRALKQKKGKSYLSFIRHSEANWIGKPVNRIQTLLYTLSKQVHPVTIQEHSCYFILSVSASAINLFMLRMY